MPAVTGVSSGLVNLAYGSMPLNSSVTASSGENGFEAIMDDVADASGIMTIDFAFNVLAGGPLSSRAERTLGSTTGDRP